MKRPRHCRCRRIPSSRPRMERLWSPAGATSGNQRQIAPRRIRRNRRFESVRGLAEKPRKSGVSVVWSSNAPTLAGTRRVDRLFAPLECMEKFSAGMWPYETMWTEDGGFRPNDERRAIAEAFFEEVRRARASPSSTSMSATRSSPRTVSGHLTASSSASRGSRRTRRTFGNGTKRPGMAILLTRWAVLRACRQREDR